MASTARHRRIDSLTLVALINGWPGFIPRPKGLKGSKAQGRAYEKKVARKLQRIWPGLISGQWFEYKDSNGIGCCQVDHYVVLPEQIVLFECKLTETDYAFSQIDLLYRPVLEMMYHRPVTGVQVCKHLVQLSPRLISDVRRVVQFPGLNFVWHCLV